MIVLPMSLTVEAWPTSPQWMTFAANAVQEKNYALMEVVLENFMEELGGERTHVLVSHLLQALSHERGPAAAAAITNDRRRNIGSGFLNAQLNHAFT